MTSTRPPLPRRWEYQLGVGLLALLVSLLRSRRVQERAALAETDAPDPSERQARRQAERAAHPWLEQLDRERTAGQAALALWLAWRSYRLERAAGRPAS